MWIFFPIINSLTLILFCVHCSGAKGSNKPYKFEAILKDVRNCANPQPPYAQKRIMYSYTEILANKNMKGNVTIKNNVPFLNFTARSYSVDSAGQRVMKFQVSRVNCRHFVAKSILLFVTTRYNKKNCLLAKGVYSYLIDINKTTHSLPVWHEEGRSIHILEVVADGVTYICNEVVVDFQPIR